MLTDFLRQQSEADTSRPVVLGLGPAGGNADIGRRINRELTDWQQRAGREVHVSAELRVLGRRHHHGVDSARAPLLHG